MKKTIPGISDKDRTLLKELLPLECQYKPQPETLDRLLDYGNTVTLRKGDTLIRVGEFDPNLYIHTAGLLRCWYWDGDKEITEYFSTIPTLFFDFHSFYGDAGSFYCYEACIDSRVVKISKHDYDRLIAESHDFTRWIMNLEQYQLYYHERKTRLAMGDAKDRYLSLLNNIPGIQDQVPLRVIASYLHITPQHLSRLRRDL